MTCKDNLCGTIKPSTTTDGKKGKKMKLYINSRFDGYAQKAWKSTGFVISVYSTLQDAESNCPEKGGSYSIYVNDNYTNEEVIEEVKKLGIYTL